MKVIFTPEQTKFINEGLGMSITVNKMVDLDKDTITKIHNFAENIEVREAIKMDDNWSDFISEEGQLACDIVDVMNVLRKIKRDFNSNEDTVCTKRRESAMLTFEQTAFLAREMGVETESVKDAITSDPDNLMNVCLGIVNEEVRWDEAGDKRHDPERLNMAEEIYEELM